MSATAIITTLGALALGTNADRAQAHAQMSERDVASLVRNYDIPAGSVSMALNRLADESDARIVYDSTLTRSLRTKGLSGRHTLNEALSEILSGTGLHYEVSEDGKSALIILAQASRAMNDASPRGAQTLPTIEVGARRGPQPARQAGAGGAGSGSGSGATQNGAPGKDALGGRLTGYNAVRAPSTLKMDTPLLQTPISVQVITRQTMDDQQAISVGDALLTNSSGVTAATTAFDWYKVRGLVAPVYKNGLLENRLRNLDTTNLQSIEVMKGPAAMLFGRGEPGGIINLVVKRPLDKPYFSVQEQVGSYSRTRTTVDATGPLTADHTLLYRFNGEFYRTDSYRNFSTDRNLFLAPTITIHPIEQFRANIDFEYQNKTWVNDYPILPAIGSGPAGIPISRYLSPASVTTTLPDHTERKRIAYDWTYDLFPGWSLTNRLSYYNIVSRTQNAIGLGFNEATGVLNRALNLFPGYTESTFATNLDLKGKFETGPLKHSVLLGYDYFGTYLPVYHYFQPLLTPINIYGPIYWRPENIYRSMGFGVAGQKWTGVYGQDMISFLDDSIHLLLGGRYDWAETGSNKISTSAINALASYNINYAEAFSPRVGLVFQPRPWLSFYGNFTQSLGANNGTTAQLLPLSPQRGEQFEGGVKAEFFDNRLTATMAYFDITKTNIPVVDPLNVNNTRVIGKVRSEGVEFDLTGRIDDNWSVIANFTHDDVRTVEGSLADPVTAYRRQLPIAGSKLPASPRNYGNLWLKYEADGDFRGLSLAGGVSAYDSALGDYANSFVLPSYALLNGMIAYSTQIQGYTVTGQLNVKNLTDVTYYPSSSDRYTILTGTPRTFLGSLRVEF